MCAARITPICPLAIIAATFGTAHIAPLWSRWFCPVKTVLSVSSHTERHSHICSRFIHFPRGVHEVAEEHNSAHVISLFRFRMRDLSPSSAKNIAALPSGCSRLLQRCQASFRFATTPAKTVSCWRWSNSLRLKRSRPGATRSPQGPAARSQRVLQRL
jgi:hypothetical protein